jgi:hypothetical protein
VSRPQPYATRRRPPRRRRRAPVLVAAVLGVVVAFAAGLGLGRALEDGPQPGRTVTAVRTLDPLPLPPATQTVTVKMP